MVLVFDSRLAAGNNGISYVLYLDYGMYYSNFLGYLTTENR